MKELAIIGAGGHGVVVAEIAKLNGYKKIFFYDDNPSMLGTNILEWKVAGNTNNIPKNSEVIIAIGDNKIRYNITNRALDRNWLIPVLIHPRAVISENVNIGAGTVIMANSVINARTTIGKGCVINTSSSVDHDCILEDFVHIAPGANIAGGIKIGEGTLVGIGSCLIPNITIGSWNVIGAGSTVIKNIQDNQIVYGNPAKPKL